MRLHALFLFVPSLHPYIRSITSAKELELRRARREGIEKSLAIIIVAPSGTIWGLFSGPDGCDTAGSGVALRSFQPGGDWTTLNRCERERERTREAKWRRDERYGEGKRNKKKQKLGASFPSLIRLRYSGCCPVTDFFVFGRKSRMPHNTVGQPVQCLSPLTDPHPCGAGDTGVQRRAAALPSPCPSPPMSAMNKRKDNVDGWWLV